MKDASLPDELKAFYRKIELSLVKCYPVVPALLKGAQQFIANTVVRLLTVQFHPTLGKSPILSDASSFLNFRSLYLQDLNFVLAVTVGLALRRFDLVWKRTLKSD